MKNIIFFLLICSFTYAQVPQGFNYQGVIRDANGDLIANQSITLAFGIITSSENNSPIYTEQHQVTTDQVGQVSLVIGNGENQTGNFTLIDWSQSPFFLSISVDVGSGFVNMGTLQLLSVPFAMYAQSSGNDLATPSLSDVLNQDNDAAFQHIENLGLPVDDFDAANKIYVDEQVNAILEEVNGLPTQNNVGDILFWDGDDWVNLAAGENGQQLIICNGVPTWATNGECPIEETPSAWPKDNTTQIVEVTSTTGKVWMDRNLGAINASTNVQNESGYGHLYQWGRSADGHQMRTSLTTTTQSSVLVPEHGLFVAGSSNWLTNLNDNLWQGEQGENNPCPDGFRLPSSAEWDAERVAWNQDNANGAFASVLKLSVGGRREHGTGNLFGVGSGGFFWSSTVNGEFVQVLNITSSLAQIVPFVRSRGYSVRCIKNE